MAEPIYIAKGDSPLYLLPALANRHGLIAGATGTGKTVTLQSLAQGFSKLGIPTFMADVKGDLSGISQPGQAKPGIAQRVQQLQRGTGDELVHPTAGARAPRRGRRATSISRSSRTSWPSSATS